MIEDRDSLARDLRDAVRRNHVREARAIACKLMNAHDETPSMVANDYHQQSCERSGCALVDCPLFYREMIDVMINRHAIVSIAGVKFRAKTTPSLLVLWSLDCFGVATVGRDFPEAPQLQYTHEPSDASQIWHLVWDAFNRPKTTSLKALECISVARGWTASAEAAFDVLKAETAWRRGRYASPFMLRHKLARASTVYRNASPYLCSFKEQSRLLARACLLAQDRYREEVSP